MLLRLLEQLLPHLFFSLYQWWIKRRELDVLNAFVKSVYEGEGDKSVIAISDQLISQDLVESTDPLIIYEGQDTALLVEGKVGEKRQRYFIDLKCLELPFAIPVTRRFVSPPSWWAEPDLQFMAALYVKAKWQFMAALNEGSLHVSIKDEKGVLQAVRRYVRDPNTVLGVLPL